jgi:hypothetical protein
LDYLQRLRLIAEDQVHFSWSDDCLWVHFISLQMGRMKLTDQGNCLFEDR